MGKAPPRTPSSKQIYRGELKECFLAQHPCLAAVDKFLGWLLMLGLTSNKIMGMGVVVCGFINHPTALGLMALGSYVCSLSISLLALMLWHTFCYYDPRMRKIMTATTRLTPTGFMRVGFLPIPAAASVGLLLFVTSTFVSSGIQPGSMLETEAGVFLPWLDGMSCRATGIENADYLTSWTARFARTNPVGSIPEPGSSVLGISGKRHKAIPGACFNAPFEFFKDDVIDPVTGKNKAFTNLVSPEGDTEGRLCMYQCVSWSTVSLQKLLANSGSISVGAGIVVVFTEWFCKMFGLAVVTENTPPKQLRGLLTKIDRANPFRRLMKPFQASMFFCALPIALIGSFIKDWLAPKVDANGFGTDDFFVTYTLLYSVAMVTIMRVWHLYACMPQIFTKKIWHDGHDTFIVPREFLEKWNSIYGEGQFKKIQDVGDDLMLLNIDLYQWTHLPGHERASLLINYCRRPGKDDTTATKMMTLGCTKVKVMHEVDLGQGTVCCEKVGQLEGGVEVDVISWKNEEIIIVNATVEGKQEQVEIHKYEVLEMAVEWESAFFASFQWHSQAYKDLEFNCQADVEAGNTEPALKQPLIVG